MLDIGWSELMVIGVVALIVVGPKDLPVMFRTLGRFTAKARSMGREFQRAMDKAADDTGVAAVAKDLKNVASPKNLGLDALQNAANRFEKWDPLKPAANVAAANPVNPTLAAVGGTAQTAPVAADAALVEPNILATEPVVAPVVHGPATAALVEANAAKAAALKTRMSKGVTPELAGMPDDSEAAPKARRKTTAKPQATATDSAPVAGKAGRKSAVAATGAAALASSGIPAPVGSAFVSPPKSKPVGRSKKSDA